MGGKILPTPTSPFSSAVDGDEQKSKRFGLEPFIARAISISDASPEASSIRAVVDTVAPLTGSPMPRMV